MNKGNLIDKLCKAQNLTKKEADLILNFILELIIESVCKNEKVTLVGFGSFRIRHRIERIRRNPRTGEKLLIPSSRIPIFSPGKFFKKKVNE